ncbi:MAG: toxin-antitoxin system HicB family antitoxin [Propionibacteriaceae bacterium]|nr:toxin-antitoxin system HicB family antitoxin [Propionibacteriaceae bacterium]
MGTTNVADDYDYDVHWSPAEAAFVATVAEFPALSWVADTAEGAVGGLGDLVHDVVGDMIANGEAVPAPLGAEHYCGRIVVCVSPRVHRRLAEAAAAAGLSVREFAAAQLEASVTSTAPRRHRRAGADGAIA